MANEVVGQMLFLNLIVVVFYLFPVSYGQTPAPSRSVYEIANPLVDLEKCGRKGMRSHICDPDGIIPVEQAYQLDDIIRSIYNDTFCPCSHAICRPESQGGYLVGIAVIRAMRLDRSIRRLNTTREDQAKYMDAVLNEARHFAYKLLQEWKMGRCNEDVLIFFSEHDSVLYTVTHSEARKKLNDDVVGEIAIHSRIHFSHREMIPEGFKEILNDYRRVFLKSYKRKSELKNEPSEIDYHQRLSGSRASSPLSCCHTTLLLLLVAAVWNSIIVIVL